MISIENLNKSFKKRKLFNNLSLSLDNDTYALLGPNGSGKTTLIRCLLSLYSYKGTITIDGLDNTSAKIGYLPQSFGLFPDLSVYEAMQYFSLLKNIENESEEINKCLSEVDMINEKNTKCKKLSGGMVRRVGIAQALLGNPEIIIFDEPTVGLDPEERLKFKNIIKGIDNKGRTIILSTHILEDVEACCNKIIVMDKGAILKTGTPSEIAEYAQNKVFECPYSNIELYKNSNVIKHFDKNSVSMCRFITNEKMDLKALQPTIEDGYLCLIKKL